MSGSAQSLPEQEEAPAIPWHEARMAAPGRLTVSSVGRNKGSPVKPWGATWRRAYMIACTIRPPKGTLFVPRTVLPPPLRELRMPVRPRRDLPPADEQIVDVPSST